jgi:hypothetical protein
MLARGNRQFTSAGVLANRENPIGKTLSTYHLIYGLRIAANRPIPGLVPLAAALSQHDLLVHLKDTPPFPHPAPFADLIYTSPYSEPDGQPSLRVATIAGGAYFAFFYSDGACYAIDREGRELWADWPEGYSIEDAATYLVGPVLGFVLRLKGITPLHASAVAIEDQAIALVGVGGAGKSTTAAAFARLGFSVLSDDVAPLEDVRGEFLVAPGYPRVNLWPDSVRALLGSEDALPRITPTWGKHYLPLDQDRRQFESRRLPLGALYFLGERDPARSEPLIEEVAAGEALLSLVANSYVNYVLDRDMRRREFELLSRLVARVPMRRILPSADPSSILAMCETIAEDARRVMKLAPAGMGSGTD